MNDDINEIRRYYPIPSKNYLRNELQDLQNEFRTFEESIAGRAECFCADNEPPPELEDNGCDCDPCNCPTDKHPCYEGPEYNNGDRSTAGLRGELARLQRLASALLAEQEAGAGCGCAARAQAEPSGKPADIPRGKPVDIPRGKPVDKPAGKPVYPRKPNWMLPVEELSQLQTEEHSGEQTEEDTQEGSGEDSEEQSEEQSGEQSEEQSEEQSGEQTEGQSEEEQSADQSGDPSDNQTQEQTGEQTQDLTQEQTRDQSQVDSSTGNPATPQGRKRPRSAESEPEGDTTLGPFRDEFDETEGYNFS